MKHLLNEYLYANHDVSGFFGNVYPSMLPYCGLRALWSSLHVNSEPMLLRWFADVGNVTHQTVQQLLGYSKCMYGDWECLDCGHTRSFSVYKLCNKCHSERMIYKELKITYSYKGCKISGKLDGLVKIDNQFYVVDYKTCDINSLEGPKPSAVLQVKAYKTLIPLTLGIQIAGWYLIYFDRSNIFRHRVFNGKSSMNLNIIHEYLTQNQVAKACLKSSKFVKQLIEIKPCSSYSEYRKNVKPCGDCILGEYGLCFHQDLERQVKLALELKKVNR